MSASDGQGGQTIMGTGTHSAAEAPNEPFRAQSGSTAPPDGADPLVGRGLAGRYHVDRKLGEGGMGAVYLGRHLQLDKSVAIKVLHPEYARKPELVERFLQEAKAASKIRHENIIDITDFGLTDDGTVFFCMEHLSGQELHELVTRAKLDGPLVPWQRTGPIFLQICAALTAAHEAGVIHRDLKPENIFLIDLFGNPDFVKLLDFGIAKMTEVNEEGRKLTKTGMLFGTPEYMSPEQARGEKPDHRVDIYAMGCILHQLVTGNVPFAGETFMGVLSQHLTEEPPVVSAAALSAVGAPQALSSIIARALEKDRDKRFSSAAELADAVRTASGGDLVSAEVAERRSRSGWRGSAVFPAANTEMTANNSASRNSASTKASSRALLFAGLGLAGILVLGAVIFAATRGGGETDSADETEPAAQEVAPSVAAPQLDTPPPVVPTVTVTADAADAGVKAATVTEAVSPKSETNPVKKVPVRKKEPVIKKTGKAAKAGKTGKASKAGDVTAGDVEIKAPAGFGDSPSSKE